MTVKRTLAAALAIMATLCFLGGCSRGGTSSSAVSSSGSEPEMSASEIPEEEPIEVDGSSDGVEIRVGGLIGPTGMGMAYMMEQDDQGATSGKYEFSLVDAPDKISPMLINGELDIAALPVNMASILHNKTNGEIKILAVNTLGVIYVLTKDIEITSVEDLRGKTIYATGQGASPEYVLRYILAQNGIDSETDVEIEFKSEHAELAALMAAGQAPIAVLPEPFVTSVLMKDSGVKVALDLTKEWESATEGTAQTLGCIVSRKEFIEAHPDMIAGFMAEYKVSAEFAGANLDEASNLMEKYGIIPNAAVAVQAIPRCNIVFMAGGEMKTAVSKYLNVLFDANPQSVGGSLPDDSFYYQG